MEAYNSYNYTCINKNRYKKSDRGDTFLKWHVSIWAGCWSKIESEEMNIMTFTLPNSPQPIINKVSFARNLDIFLLQYLKFLHHYMGELGNLYIA